MSRWPRYEVRRIGTLCLIDRQPREFGAEDAIILADLAAMVDRELALLDRAATDELTSLSNRRGFAAVVQQVLALCDLNQQPAVVVGIDLDNFKSINDDFGHEAGDYALRVFARLLAAHFRESDVVARVGGDEFAVLCSAAIPVQLTDSLERLADTFDPDSDATVDDLLRTADARMYAAKVESRRSRQQR